MSETKHLTKHELYTKKYVKLIRLKMSHKTSNNYK